MRGQIDPQGKIFSDLSIEGRIPADRPLRRMARLEAAETG